ncbi:MFS transporter [Streptomyces sp. NPDC055709]
MPRRRWLVLVVSTLAVAAGSAQRLGLPSVGPFFTDHYHLSLTQWGVLVAMLPAGVVVGTVPWGWLTDRLSERMILPVGLIGAAVTLVATTQARSYPAVLGALFCTGMFAASAAGASGRAVIGWFSAAERGLALSIRHAAVPIGGAVAAATLPLVARYAGLAGVFWALASWSFAAGAAAALFMRTPPYTSSPATSDQGAPMRHIWRLGLGSAALITAQACITGFLVVFLRSRGLSIELAALLLAGVQVAGGIGRIVTGRLSDRAGRRIAPMRHIALATTILVLAAGLCTLASVPVACVVLVVAGVFSMSWNGLASAAAGEMAARARVGTAMSLQNMCALASATVAPICFGVIVDATSWPIGFVALALGPLAAWFSLRSLEHAEATRAGHVPCDRVGGHPAVPDRQVVLSGSGRRRSGI